MKLLSIKTEAAPDAVGIVISGHVSLNDGRIKYFFAPAANAEILRDPRWWEDFEDQILCIQPA